MFQSILAEDSMDFEAAGRIGAASVRLHDTLTARAMDDRLKNAKGLYLMGGPQRWRAVIAMAQGKPEEAANLLESGVRQGYRLLDNPMNLTVHLDRDFVGFEKTAPYKSLLQSLTDASK
jgi:hypothetical protein